MRKILLDNPKFSERYFTRDCRIAVFHHREEIRDGVFMYYFVPEDTTPNPIYVDDMVSMLKVDCYGLWNPLSPTSNDIIKKL